MLTDQISSAPTTYNLGAADRIPIGEGRRFIVGATEVAVFRTRDGGVYAVQADCPHRGGPLADGIVGDGKVVCPLHGYTFELATGEPVRHGCAALRSYPVEVTDSGEVLIHLQQPLPDAG